MKEELTIRVAKPEDAKGLLEIYAPYVEKTAITFEYVVPSEKEFAERIRHILTKYPYLVLEENGELLGYVYAGTFNERSAYDWASGKFLDNCFFETAPKALPYVNH